MQSFSLVHPTDIEAAIAAASADGVAYIAGGTDLMQLMKDNVAAPRKLVDLEGLQLTAIEANADGLRLGALATMASVAAHPEVRQGWPMIVEALLLSASPQVRNMGTVGGNLLQRTRCGYFRDTGFACNKREPGSGCPAIRGENRMLAVLGGSEHCIATHPSDMPVALIALGAAVELRAPGGSVRKLALSDFYRLPGDTPHVETNLRPGELITAVLVPASEAARRSVYVKVRDRESFEFALVSAAVGLAVESGMIADARVAMGGVGTVPWRMHSVESALRGRKPEPGVLEEAAQRAADGAKPATQNGFKPKLMQRTVLRALQTVAA
jgi:xanthine dehydrogenase YagS FAD-binding subunit